MRALVVTVCATAIFYGATAYSQGADVVVTCWNPQQNVPVTHHRRQPGAAEFVVQFNLGPQSTGGAIFVNDDNNGWCRADVKSGKHVVGQPQWRLVSEDPAGAFSGADISATVAADKSSATYAVKRGQAPNSTVTLKFVVEYQ